MEKSILIELLPKYRLLNSLYRQIADDSTLSFQDQCRITDFYNEFKYTLIFDKTILHFILTADNVKQSQVIESFRAEINKNIEIYTNNKMFFDNIEICVKRHKPYQFEIEVQLERTNKAWNTLKIVRGNLEAESWKGNKTITERLFKEEENLDLVYKEEQNKLDILYRKEKESEINASKYTENLFGKIYELSISFQTIINSYFPIEKEKEEIIIPDTVSEETDSISKISHVEIEPDMIFRTKMYEKFLLLEQKLINDKYLDENLYWTLTHKNNRTNIKDLIAFFVGLLENGYFLPNKDPKIKSFFETRYNISIGQNFERKRREPLLNEYKIIFHDYLF